MAVTSIGELGGESTSDTAADRRLELPSQEQRMPVVVDAGVPIGPPSSR